MSQKRAKENDAFQFMPNYDRWIKSYLSKQNCLNYEPKTGGKMAEFIFSEVRPKGIYVTDGDYGNCTKVIIPGVMVLVKRPHDTFIVETINMTVRIDGAEKPNNHSSQKKL